MHLILVGEERGGVDTHHQHLLSLQTEIIPTEIRYLGRKNDLLCTRKYTGVTALVGHIILCPFLAAILPISGCVKPRKQYAGLPICRNSLGFKQVYIVPQYRKKVASVDTHRHSFIHLHSKLPHTCAKPRPKAMLPRSHKAPCKK